MSAEYRQRVIAALMMIAAISVGVVSPAISAAEVTQTPLGLYDGVEPPGPPLGTVGIFSCAAVHSFPVSFNASIGGGWDTVDARSHPFQSCEVTGRFHRGDAFPVDHQTENGQKICLHPVWHVVRGEEASTVWYHTSRGWIWSGATSDPVWNKKCA